MTSTTIAYASSKPTSGLMARYGEGWAIIAGLLLPFAFAPTHLSLLAIFSPALFLLTLLPVSARRAALRGFLFAVAFFGVGVSWVYVSLQHYGHAPVPLAILITGIFISLTACFPTVFAYLLNKFYPRPTFGKCLLAFPAGWVIFEWLRSWIILNGFPWLYLGESQLQTPLSGFAPMGSVYLVSWAVALCAGALAGLFFFRKLTKIMIATSIIVIIFIGGWALNQIHWTQPIGSPINVSLIQGHIPQGVKWNPTQTQKTLTTYLKLTRLHWQSQLIIWPESAITIPQVNANPLLDNLGIEAKNHNASLITGIPIFQDGHYYNGMMSLGKGQGQYLKRHLVPFGEYIPLRAQLMWLKDYIDLPMSDFSRGGLHQPLLTAGKFTVAPYICYEIAYPSEVRNTINKANLIVTITDDSWFGKSFAPAQHLEIAAMRAKETGRYLLMATNDGITAIINPEGQIVKTLPPFTRGVLTGEISAMQGETPWLTWGVVPVLLLMLGLLIIATITKF